MATSSGVLGFYWIFQCFALDCFVRQALSAGFWQLEARVWESVICYRSTQFRSVRAFKGCASVCLLVSSIQIKFHFCSAYKIQ